jgi:hypothetical protein
MKGNARNKQTKLLRIDAEEGVGRERMRNSCDEAPWWRGLALNLDNIGGKGIAGWACGTQAEPVFVRTAWPAWWPEDGSPAFQPWPAYRNPAELKDSHRMVIAFPKPNPVSYLCLKVLTWHTPCCNASDCVAVCAMRDSYLDFQFIGAQKMIPYGCMILNQSLFFPVTVIKKPFSWWNNAKQCMTKNAGHPW